MIKWNAYARLLRLNKPVGILLLWYPTAWALWIANQGMFSLKLFILFLTGTVLMRSAGCVINDIADRHVDKHVARTQSRPVTSGEVSLPEAFTLLFILLGMALWILINLPPDCFYLAIIALVITIVYPFCKRFLNAPQMVLGIAFSMGIPMVYVASDVPINRDFILLILINFAWIVAYDTMYAMTDREDDLKIGVKSTAIYFGNQDRLVIGLLQITLHALWLIWAIGNNVGWGFFLLWFLASGVLVYQQKLIYKRAPRDCFKAFLMSSYYGLLMWIGIGIAI